MLTQPTTCFDTRAVNAGCCLARSPCMSQKQMGVQASSPVSRSGFACNNYIASGALLLQSEESY